MYVVAASRTGKREFRDAIQHRLLPTLRANAPDLVLLSAGFDGGNGDVGNLHTGLGEVPGFLYLVQCTGSLCVMHVSAIRDACLRYL